MIEHCIIMRKCSTIVCLKISGLFLQLEKESILVLRSWRLFFQILPNFTHKITIFHKTKVFYVHHFALICVSYFIQYVLKILQSVTTQKLFYIMFLYKKKDFNLCPK